MTNPVDSILETLAALRSAWTDAAPAGDERGMRDAALLGIHEQLAAARRQLDGLHTRVAAEMAVRSRPELGKEGLARQAGFRSAAKLIAAATGGHTGDAARLIQVGEATRERESLTGEAAPPRHPHIAGAVRTGAISVAAASAIGGMLDRIALRVEAARLMEAESVLAEKAALLSLDELNAVLRRAEAYLDPYGLEPTVTELRDERLLKIRHDRSGKVLLEVALDPEDAAPVITAIDAIVTAQLRTSRGHHAPGGLAVDSSTAQGGESDQPAPAEDKTATAAGSPDAVHPGPVAPETRTLPQMRADALVALCRHALGCDSDALPRSATTVVVRMTLDDLRSGTGVATIDGIAQPVDAGAARRLAAAADLIPCVLGTDSEVLDLGRRARHFTPAQRLALVERDGGCAFCHLPPAYAEAHHIRWWMRDTGPTDLENGILLCTACHHRVHADGWEIRIESPPGGPPSAGTVWFLPPPHIDPARTPRLGGRKRFDPLAWRLAA